MTILKSIKTGIAASALLAGMYGCIPAPDVKSPVNPAEDLIPRPVINILGTDFQAANLEQAYVISGDSITFNLSAEAPSGIAAVRTIRINSTTYNPLLLRRDTFTDNRTSHTYQYGYRVPNFTVAGSWVRLSFYVRDKNGNESFRHFRLNVMTPTRGTAIQEVILYRQGFDPAVATAGTVYAQFLSTRRQQTAARFRSDLGIDLCYGVNPATGVPHLFSPDLPAADINSQFPGFPTSQIQNPFNGGLAQTTLTTASVPVDSLRRSKAALTPNKVLPVARNQSYLVRCFPLDPLTPPYCAVLNVTNIADSIVFGSGPNRTVVRGAAIQMRANVAILR